MDTRDPPAAPDAKRQSTLSVWRAYLPAAAAAFVVGALIALAATPILTFRRLDALRAHAAETTGAAERALAELHVLFMSEVILHQTMRAGADPTAVARYDTAHMREEALLTQLRLLGPRIGADVPGRVAATRRAAGRWHALADARASGRLSEAEFAALLPRVRALHDSALVAHAQLADEVQRVDARDDDALADVERRQGQLALGLGALAAAAAVAVAAAARRERRLTAALERAVEEESRLRGEAERQHEALIRLGESKARLVRGFTHDVKNPIGAADGYLQLLEDGLPDPPTTGQRRSLERARRSLGAAVHLIGDLLEVSQAETGDIEVHAEPTDLAAVAREAAEEYRAQAAAKGLALHVVLDELVPTLTSDPVRVRQVLGNLICNAVKYTPAGSVEVRLLGPRTDRGAATRRCAVTVTDTGPGIAPEQQARLFEEFVRLDPSVAPGAGVGLAISRRIAHALGGDLSVRSAVGRGSTFVLWLPAA